MPLKILHVVGARPNFMKIAPVMRSFERASDVSQVLVHTGQHYDDELSKYFFEDLQLPKPDLDLGVGSGSHALQTAKVMIALEPVVQDQRPDWVFTVGDVNSTLAAALVAAKLGIRVAHVEAGLRSRRWSMPEEINRVLTDRLSDLLFTTEPSANENLKNEGIEDSRVHFVGNVMIDTLDRFRDKATALDIDRAMGLETGRYVLVTLHRPRNVDDPVRLAGILDVLPQIAFECQCPVIVPVHPRTAQNVRDFGLGDALSKIQTLKPLRYLEFLCLMDRAGAVLTDSGGIQEETTVLGVPCVTLRPETERPITIAVGTNRLFDSDLATLPEVVRDALAGERRSVRPELWDGRAGDRVVDIVLGNETLTKRETDVERLGISA